MMVQTKELLRRWQEGDKEARNQLVEENIGLVRHIVKRYQGRGYDLEDLFQIGSIGLLKAIDKFDMSYEVCLSTYAVPMIHGEIRRYIRDDGLIKVSRSVKENVWKLKKTTSEFLQKNGHEPTISELERLTGLQKDDIILALESDREVASIYQSVYQSDGNEIYLMDQLAEKKVEETSIYETPALEEVDVEKEVLLNHIVLMQLIEGLEDTERKVIYLRYFQEKTQMEVARILGITQVKVSRIEKKTLCKMRQQVMEEKK